MKQIILALACLLAVPTDAADWPSFRGPGGQGVSSQTGLPLKWGAEQNIVWKTALPGYGASSPIVVGQRILLTSYSGYGLGKENPAEKGRLRLHVMCLDRATGRIQWDKSIPTKPKRPVDHQTDYVGFTARHGYASGTPVTDGKAVFAYFGEHGVVAFDLSGRALWTTNVGSKTHGFGSGTSPVLSGQLLLVNASIESESLVALDKATGGEVWRVPGIDDSWNTPLLVDAPAGRKELVLMTKSQLRAFDPLTGQPLWHCAGSKPPRYICPSATAADGVVYAVNGYHGPAIGVRSGGSGDVSTSHQLWSVRKGSNVSSPVYHAGHLYWINDQGFAIGVNATDGRLVYQERLEPAAGDVYASPIAADGKLYYVSRKSGTYVLAAQPKFQLLAHNVMTGDDSVFNASPVVSGKALLLRSDKFLYCIGNK